MTDLCSNASPIRESVSQSGRRVLAVWLPGLPLEHRRQTEAPDAPGDRPLALVAEQHGRSVLTAVNPPAATAGLEPGQALADARALAPDLSTRPADPMADARALARLADWAGRYTPWVATCGDPASGEGGLLLDITGCAHLFGGEAGLVRNLASRLADLGISCRIAVADTIGTAWAVARAKPGYRGPGDPLGVPLGDALVTPGRSRTALANLPMNGLRLDPGCIADLSRLGLRRIGDLYTLPRQSLAARFRGPTITNDPLRRLDQALGQIGEPVSPRRPIPRFRMRQGLAEPIASTEAVCLVLDRLLAQLCAELGQASRGARAVTLELYRVDGGVQRLSVGTSRPTRRADALKRLFVQQMDSIDAGFGIETAALAATATQPLGAEQVGLADDAPGRSRAALADLVDRLENRLGRGRVARPVPQQSHLPERATTAAPPLARIPPADWPAHWRRPVRLLADPQPVEAVAPVPDDPPVLFRWHGRVHRVARADGPERLLPEWWRPGGPEDLRDYYRVEDTDGDRFWLYRAGLYAADQPSAWFLHGLFA